MRQLSVVPGHLRSQIGTHLISEIELAQPARDVRRSLYTASVQHLCWAELDCVQLLLDTKNDGAVVRALSQHLHNINRGVVKVVSKGGNR